MGKFVIKKAKKGPMFNLKAGNGQIILTSEVYSSEAACKNGIKSVITNSAKAKIEDQTVKGFAVEKNPKFEIYLDKRKENRFRFKAKNGEIIGTSQGYSSKTGCKNGINSIIKNCVGSETVHEK